MLQTAVQAAQETVEHAGGVHPVALGLIAFGGLVFALVVTYAFRNVWNRH
ncbi:hypothetical protein [Xylanimonas oleitrophica]|nr:hypothetical protein [Xylanimonas oleitrophica]